MDRDAKQSSKEVGRLGNSDNVNGVKKLIFCTMLVGIKDRRSFTGTLHCIDKQGNIILQDATEYRSSQRAPAEKRFIENLNPHNTTMMELWFAGTEKLALRCKEAVSLLFHAIFGGFGAEFLVMVMLMKNVLFAAFTCLLALGGSMVGTVVGAMKGHTTESGFIGGAGIGAVTGAIMAMQLLESALNGDSLPVVAMLGSLVSGKVFMEWVSPAVLKAYQWQVSMLGTTYREITDIYDTFDVRGLSYDCIQQFPDHEFHSSKMTEPFDLQPCSICLQGFIDGERARRLPSCEHMFHVGCIDQWLRRQGSCPMCRQCLWDDI